MLQTRYVPALQFTGIQHQLLLPRLKMNKSAAGIGEALCSKALDVGADLVLIASHGAGVLADYGSVARCVQRAAAVGRPGSEPAFPLSLRPQRRQPQGSR